MYLICFFAKSILRFWGLMLEDILKATSRQRFGKYSAAA